MSTTGSARRLAAAAAVVLGVLAPVGVPPAAAAVSATTSADVSTADVHSLRADTLAELNRYRAARGAQVLRRDGGLDGKAQAWAETIARTGRYVHNPDLGYPAGLTGNSEIILKAGVDNGSAAVAVRSWAGSPPHQRIMALPQMTLAGIGVARTGRDVYYVVNFAHPVAAPPPATQTVEFRRGGAVVTVGGAILQAYRQQGLDRGVIGWPLTPEFGVHGGRGQHFDRGSVYWSAPTGAHVARGAIRDRWAAMGWERSWLGMPTTSEFAIRGGALQRFSGGLVYHSPGTGAHAVRGAILQAYGDTGWENGRLGYPLTSETALPAGAFTHFQGGSIYHSRATGAHVVEGAIREAWARAGWENGRLGYPRTGEYPVAGGVRQDFTGGSLTYTWAGGRIHVTHR